MGLFTTGCEDASRVDGVSWNAATPTVSTDTTTPPTVDQGTGDVLPPGVDSYLDAVSYGSFNWTYGGVKGSGAAHSGVNITGFRISGKTLSFKYVNNLSAWGLSNSDAGALACLFVMNSSGQWVGGKFDWISTSRESRGLEHCFGAYDNWTMNGIPNPTQAAFVILSANGTRRSNVVAGTWAR